jgi:DNA-binding transcriptional LysR family regulator
MVPTAKAVELIAPLRSSLDQLRGTLQGHDSFDPATAELTISIACTDYVEAVVMAPLIVTLREKAPKIRLALHRLVPASVARQLADGDIDLAIATVETVLLEHLWPTQDISDCRRAPCRRTGNARDQRPSG